MTRPATFRRVLTAAALALAALVSTPVHAQGAPPPKPALWVVQDADTTLYLFGTIHFMRPDLDWRTARVTEAMEASDALVLEVADPDDRAAVAPLIQQYGMSPDRPLSSLLNADDLVRLDTAARTLGASASQMDQLRPWLAGVMLSSALPARGGFEANFGVDVQLRADAARASKPIRGLETPADQVRMLSGFSEEGQIAFLRNTLDNFGEAPVELGQLADAWTRGDVEGIHEITLAPMKARTPIVYETTIVARNRRWAEQVAIMLDEPGTSFVAVGALHLAGDDSVQRLLNEAGIAVVRIQ